MGSHQPDPMTANHMSQFIQSLECSVQLSLQLERTLLDETRAIEMRDPDDLLRVVTDKQSLVVQLEAETGKQKQWVELAGHTFTPVGMAKFFASFDQDGRSLGRWSSLRESIARCDRLNQANARLIERDRQRINLTLRILNGDDGFSTTYNLRGSREPGGLRSRSISQA